MLYSKKLQLKIAREIAEFVSKTVRKASDLGALVGTIGYGGDGTKRGDQLVEDTIKKYVPKILKKNKVNNCLVISEENGIWEIGDVKSADGLFMVIDPIDGSNNMRPHPTPKPFLGFSIAIGTLECFFNDGTFDCVEAAVVKDIFYDDEYSATKDGGAFLNKKIVLHSSPVTTLETANIYASLDRFGQKLQDVLDKGVLKLLLATKCQRRLGSVVLDLSRVASGDCDAGIGMSGETKVHDLIAVNLIIKEAGGVLAIFRGGKIANQGAHLKEIYKLGSAGIDQIKFEFIAAGNEILLEKIKQIVA